MDPILYDHAIRNLADGYVKWMCDDCAVDLAWSQVEKMDESREVPSQHLDKIMTQDKEMNDRVRTTMDRWKNNDAGDYWGIFFFYILPIIVTIFFFGWLAGQSKTPLF